MVNLRNLEDKIREKDHDQLKKSLIQVPEAQVAILYNPKFLPDPSHFKGMWHSLDKLGLTMPSPREMWFFYQRVLGDGPLFSHDGTRIPNDEKSFISKLLKENSYWVDMTLEGKCDGKIPDMFDDEAEGGGYLDEYVYFEMLQEFYEKHCSFRINTQHKLTGQKLVPQKILDDQPVPLGCSLIGSGSSGSGSFDGFAKFFRFRDLNGSFWPKDRKTGIKINYIQDFNFRTRAYPDKSTQNSIFFRLPNPWDLTNPLAPIFYYRDAPIDECRRYDGGEYKSFLLDSPFFYLDFIDSYLSSPKLKSFGCIRE